jgi:hypothetical protein
MKGRGEIMRTPVVGSRLLLLFAVGLLVLEIAAVGQAAPAPAEQPTSPLKKSFFRVVTY